MAPLASIPEVNTLRSSFDTHRPRSRVVFLSRRPGRPRCSARKPATPAQSPLRCQRDTGRGNNSQNQHRYTINTSPSTVSKAGSSPTWTQTSSEIRPSLPHHLRGSESSFDLDSFPKPPSNNTHRRPLQCRHTVRTTSPENRHAASKAPLALAQRKLLVPTQREPADIRHSLFDAAADLLSPQKRQSVDLALVAAVSRSIAQQLRIFSSLRSQAAVASNDDESRTSSRRRALNQFTRDLELYADTTAARGKRVHVTSTPPTDAATLHTVSELLPFRPQLRAAGLAVTSREQAQGVPRYLNGGQSGRPSRKSPRRRPDRDRPRQLDGYTGDDSGPSTNTEISFAKSHAMDEFRYALIDEAPIPRKKGQPAKKRSNCRCLPCFPTEDDFTTDPEWAHFKPPSARPANVVPKKISKEMKRFPAPYVQPLQPSPTRALAYDSSFSRKSPHQKSISREVEGAATVDRPDAWGRPNFITTGRRHSMTLPKANPQGAACSIGHENRQGKGSQDGRGQDPVAASQNGKPYTGNNATGSRKFSRPLMVQREGNMPVKPSGSQRERQGAPVLKNQADGQRGPRIHGQQPTRSARAKSGPVSRYDPHHIGICCPKSRGVPAKLTARPNIPRRTSSIQGSFDSIEVDYDDAEIADRDVLRGLHVAASAACNEEVDAFVRNKTGLRIRRFLADLMALETLTAFRPGEDNEQHARRRRAEMRALKKQVRRSREVVMTGGLI